jgi:transposase
VQKYEVGAYDDDAPAADTVQEYEVRIAAQEGMVGRQALESELQRGASRNAPRPRNGPTSVITGLASSPLPKDAG